MLLVELVRGRGVVFARFERLFMVKVVSGLFGAWVAADGPLETGGVVVFGTLVGLGWFMLEPSLLSFVH